MSTIPIPAELMLKMVLNGIPAAIFWKDRSSRILGCNQTFATGFADPSELIGTTNFDFYPAEQAEAFRANDLKVINSGKDQLAVDEQLTLGSGEIVGVETNKLPLRDAAGDIIGVLGTYRDVTVRSVLGQGSAFQLRLPLTPAASPWTWAPRLKPARYTLRR